MSTGSSDRDARVDIPLDGGVEREELFEYLQSVYFIHGSCTSVMELGNAIVKSKSKLQRIYGAGRHSWSGGEEVAQKVGEMLDPGVESFRYEELVGVDDEIDTDYDAAEIDSLSEAYELRRWMEAQARVVDRALEAYSREETPELERGVSLMLDASAEMVEDVELEQAQPSELKDRMLERGEEPEVAGAAVSELETAQVYATYITDVREEFPDPDHKPEDQLMVP